MDGEESSTDEMEVHSIRAPDSSDESIKGKEGNIALHSTVMSACRESNTHARSYKDIDVFMTREEVKVNMPNKEGYTAIGLAVYQLHGKTCIEHMLKHPSSRRLYLDYYPGDRDNTVREIIMETYPDLQPLLPAPLMESLNSTEKDKKLLAALQRDEFGIFCLNLYSNNSNSWYDEPYYSSLLEIACQMKNRKRFVELLLDSGADPNITNRVTGMPLLHATARSGNLEVLEMLLERKTIDVSVKDNEQRTILHWWARVSERNQDDKERLENCFKLLEQQKFDLRVGIANKDSSGNTALSIAVQREFTDRITLLLDTDSEQMESYDTIRILESASTSLRTAIVDNCFESNDEDVTSKDLKVTFKFTALLRIVNFVEGSHHKDLLRHPVMSSFVNLIWKTVRYFFFLDVAFYVMFLLSLTAYILFSEYFIIHNNGVVTSNTDGVLNFNDSHMTSGMKDEELYNISQGLWYTLMVLLGLLSVREVCQLLLYRKTYMYSTENWLELLLIVVTFTSCSGVVDSIETKRHLFAITILLAWFELVLLLGRLPLLSVQTEMLKTVSWTFLSFMAGYIVLILAFAFSFYILFKENSEVGDTVLFTNPFISLLKAIVMFAGEFEASNLPFDTLPGTSHVIFLLFVFLVAIVLLNLLNGLAVGDTHKIRDSAETLSIVARLHLIGNLLVLYYALPYFMILSAKLEEKMSVLYPNKPNQIGSTDLQSLRDIISEKRKRNEKDKSIEKVENWRLFAEKLSALQLQSEEIRQILMKIQTHLNIGQT